MTSVFSSPLRRALAVAALAVVAFALALAVQSVTTRATGQAGVTQADGQETTTLAAVSTGQSGGSSNNGNANKSRR
jgi:hypothetical protein